MSALDDPASDLPTVGFLRADGASEPARSRPGRSLANGRYLLIRALGHGGQKDAFLARDVRLERIVVVSFVRTDRTSEGAIDRFLREARVMAQIGDHANIVTVYDYGEDDGTPYFVSQHVEDLALGQPGTPFFRDHRFAIDERRLRRVGKPDES